MTGFLGLLGEVLGLRQIDDSQSQSSAKSTDTVVGSGISTTQERDLAGCFDGLEVEGSVDVELRRGELCTVKVIGDDNLVDLVDTSVSAMRLYVGFKPNTNIRTKIGLKVVVTAPELDEIDLNGSGDLQASGLRQDIVRLNLNGSGDVDLSGDVQVASLHVAGSGDISATSLKAREASVFIHGSGDADVYASERLNVNINGSGDVIVNGSPKHRVVNVHGSGKVHYA